MSHRQAKEQPVQERARHRLILTRVQEMTCRCTTNLRKRRTHRMVRKRIPASRQTTRRNRMPMCRPTAGCQKEMRCIAHLLLAIRSCRCCTTWAGSSRITARLTVRSMACGSTASAAVSSSANALPRLYHQLCSSFGMFTLTPLTSTPSSAGMSRYLRPPIMRASMR